MSTGKVKFVNIGRGYGFIIPDGGGPDVFFHVNQVADGIKVTEGDAVRFDAGQDRLGRARAMAVSLVD